MLSTLGENPLRACEFGPASITVEAADSVAQLRPIPVTDKVEKIQQTAQFEQRRALVACELKRSGQGRVA